MLREPNGLLASFARGRMEYVEDIAGNRITLLYTDDRLSRLQHSSGQWLSVLYNTNGRIERLLDSNARETAFTYDSLGAHLIQATYDDGRASSYSYILGTSGVREHALETVAYPDGTSRTFRYDTFGRLIETHRNADRESTAFTYDSTGTVTVTDATRATTTISYDANGLPARVRNGLGKNVYRTFNSDLRVTRVTNALGQSYEMAYDYDGNLAGIRDALGGSTLLTYETLSENDDLVGPYDAVASVEDPNGNTRTFTHSDQGYLVTATYADGASNGWNYDQMGNTSRQTNRRGQVVAFRNDADGSQTERIYEDGSLVRYVYDARGNLTSATVTRSAGQVSTTTYSYDADDYLERVEEPNGRWLAFTYDEAGRRSSSTDQSGRQVHYHYDSLGRLQGLTDAQDQPVIAYQYDTVGRLARVNKGNGRFTTYAYDLAGQLTRITYYNPDDTEQGRIVYEYDPVGNRTVMKRTTNSVFDGQWTYEYDESGQLIHAAFDVDRDSNPELELVYEFDAAGNRIEVVENGDVTYYVTNNMNQYESVGEFTYEYDADGNLIGKTNSVDTWTYEYDSENRLISITGPDGTWTVEYDALGARIATERDGERTEYQVDPIGMGNVVGEYDGEGDRVAQYIYGLGLAGQIDGVGGQYWYDYDALGSTVQRTGDDASVSDSYFYRPFGSTHVVSESTYNPFQFIGRLGVQADHGNGLQFMRARFYDATIGRFVSEDPIGLGGGDLNTYRYVVNAVTSHVDPIGLESLEGSGFGGAGFGGYGGVNVGPNGSIDVTVGVGAAVGGGVGVGVSTSTPGSGPSVGITGAVSTPYGLGGSVTIGTGGGDASVGVGPGLGGFAGVTGTFCVWNCGGGAGSGGAGGGSNHGSNPPGKGGGAGGDGDSGDRGSTDPNEKTGPGGHGDANYVGVDAVLPYRVDFENDPEATAPAQFVAVSDRLSDELDWSTFQLTEIAFGDQMIAVPEGTQHYETVVPMIATSGEEIDVHVEAGIRLGTGEVYALLMSIDPETELPPEVMTGFLPPEDGTGRGMGHISYLVYADADLPSGTEIRNIAEITFDFGETIATNQVDPHDPNQGTDPDKEALVTIDAGLPSSAVDPLPAEVAGTTVSLTWQGQDDVGGSGIAHFDIFVSDNDSPFQLWLDNSPDTSADFTGQSGHTYQFYSVATDNVGQRESAPLVPDAQTLVMADEPPQVTDVLVYGEDWNAAVSPYSLIDRTSPGVPLPWVNIDRIDVVFSKNVEVVSQSLTLTGVNTPVYSPSDFDYQTGSFSATWTFAQAFGADKLRLNLAGEATDAHAIDDQAGEGGQLLGGGVDFELGFDVVAGDSTGDGVTDIADLVNVATRVPASIGPPPGASYSRQFDVNGDGTIDIGDLVNVATRVPSSLPAGEPGGSAGADASYQALAPAFPPGDANRDLVFNQLDLVDVLRDGKYLTGTPADWSEGDWNDDGRFDQMDVVHALATGRYLGRSVDGRAIRASALLPADAVPGRERLEFAALDQLFGEALDTGDPLWRGIKA